MRKPVQAVWLAPLAAIAGVLCVLALRSPAPPAETVTARPPAASSSPTPTPEQPAALWIGDSYTAGTGAKSPTRAESCLTSDAMGWICNLDAQGGTGFIANGHRNNLDFEPLGKRLAATHERFLADVVIVDAGRNDGSSPPSEVIPAARDYLRSVESAWPKAKLVVVLPYFMSSGAEPPSRSLNAALRSETERLGGQVIDPIGEGWINDRAKSLTISDGVHPNPAGHRYIARHLTQDLRRLGLGEVPITDTLDARQPG